MKINKDCNKSGINLQIL